ncbi:MAG TPA: caspase family protein [Vicinamibacterales bacterium]|nr:caspase family protein [Vicinamibacterales bacterium]
MGLVFDQRDALGHGPGCHALIVGVSGYPYLDHTAAPRTRLNLGLLPLSSAALSAKRVYDWLVDAKLAKPLATVRLLLSPAADDVFDSTIEKASLDQFIRDAADWRADASEHQENMTFFYFAGQGFSLNQGEHVLALQDFGDAIGPALRHTVKVNNVVDGMAPGWMQNMARTQLYFIDANRRRPQELLSYPSLLPTAVFDVAPAGIDDRTTAVFYAASPDSEAWAYKKQQTFFSRALVTCLEGAAAIKQPDQRWAVSVQSLCQALPKQVADLAAEAEVRQQVVIEGSLREAIISHLEHPPLVGVAVHLEPAAAAATAHARLSNDEGTVVAEWDARDSSAPPQVPAGLYLLDVNGEGSNGSPFSMRKFIQAVGPLVELTLKLPF